ncbi:MAG TPA: tRNA1(Val) (adenine(37)-N6)-methyltransferase [Syntrophomonadaceae bacterium]|nr:tRNA1(Val) (adenine(37)-N6)-methyltransferase [Syntrophomonadaceae bacterium]
MLEDTILKNGESLDDLILGDLKIIQARKGYRFSLDALLLAHFCSTDGVRDVFDFGTGSGIIPIILTFRAPELKITGIDLQAQMVERARRSVKLNNLQDKIGILEQDIKKLEEVFSKGLADLVVCNPPFYKKGEGQLSSNSEAAIARHELELTLGEIIKQASYILKDRGKIALIQRASRLTEVISLFTDYKIKTSRIRMVHTKLDSEAKLCLIEGQKHGRLPLEILAPLIIYQADGQYSEEIKKWYQKT